MTSFVIASTSKIKRKAYIEEYCRELNIDKYDITLVEKDNQIKTNTQSIGIDEIKNLHKKIFLKPINSEVKAVVIDDAEMLTTEAQNALLKVLEEPPSYTIIILGAANSDSLLPTILSRCQIIELSSEILSLSDAEKQEHITFLTSIPSMQIGDRLKAAEDISLDKDAATLWIGKLILTLREQIIEQSDQIPLLFSYIKSLEQLHKLLKTTNVNHRFAIENTLLSI